MNYNSTINSEVWRIILIETNDAATNMALDEACMEAVRTGRAPPTIRLYRWSPSAISIGNFQCFSDEVDVAACESSEIAIVRRETGGGAVFHDTEGEITYSIIAPVDAFPKDIIASYRDICAVLIDALREVSVEVEFKPINDLVCNGKKISGNAQTRKGGILLQHGTILYTVNAEKMFRFLTPDKSKIADKPFIKSVESMVTSIREHSAVSRDSVEFALIQAFTKRFNCTPGEWTPSEIMRARELAESKYSSREWTYLR